MKDYVELIGKEVVAVKAGSQRSMEHIYLTTIGVLDTVEHSYIRICRTDLTDPVRSEPFYTCYTFADFITGRYQLFTKEEFDKLTPEELLQIRSVRRPVTEMV